MTAHLTATNQLLQPIHIMKPEVPKVALGKQYIATLLVNQHGALLTEMNLESRMSENLEEHGCSFH